MRSLARVEMIHLLLDQVSDGVGDDELDLVDRFGHLPAVFVLLDQSLGHEVVDRVHHEQRIALRSFVDQRRDLGGKPVGWET